jgi:hypothetical protein
VAPETRKRRLPATTLARLHHICAASTAINFTWDFFLEITLSFLNLSNISGRKDFSVK